MKDKYKQKTVGTQANMRLNIIFRVVWLTTILFVANAQYTTTAKTGNSNDSNNNQSTQGGSSETTNEIQAQQKVAQFGTYSDYTNNAGNLKRGLYDNQQEVAVPNDIQTREIESLERNEGVLLPVVVENFLYGLVRNMDQRMEKEDAPQQYYNSPPNHSPQYPITRYEQPQYPITRYEQPRSRQKRQSGYGDSSQLIKQLAYSIGNNYGHGGGQGGYGHNSYDYKSYGGGYGHQQHGYGYGLKVPHNIGYGHSYSKAPLLSFVKSFKPGKVYVDKGHVVRNYYRHGTYKVALQHYKLIPSVKVVPYTSYHKIGHGAHIQTKNKYSAKICKNCYHGYPKIDVYEDKKPYSQVVRRFVYLPKSYNLGKYGSDHGYGHDSYGHDNYGYGHSSYGGYGHGYGGYGQGGYGHGDSYGHDSYGYGHDSYGHDDYGHKGYGHDSYGYGHDNHGYGKPHVTYHTVKDDYGYGHNSYH